MSTTAVKDVLRGAKVALTGRFASMSHAELAELVGDFGGEFVPIPSRHTKYLIIGQEGLPLGEDGRPTSALQKARQLESIGHPIEILSEELFLAKLGLSDREQAVHRRYTSVQLSRILGVPGERIRAWVRGGLIEPAETINRLAFFDFYQVASARTLCELTEAGLPPSRIREGLEQMRTLLPDVESPLSQIRVLEKNPRMLVRLESGQLAEPTGQLQLDFDDSNADSISATVALPLNLKSVDAWFDEGVALEDARRFQEAADAYREAIALEPDDPVLHFNLGNALFQLDQAEASAEQFRQAVSLDPAYVEAWNNLGNLLVHLGLPDEAITSFRRALSLVPNYADAHYNLAQALARLGKSQEARQHWRTYLKFDPTSPWADEALLRLAE